MPKPQTPPGQDPGFVPPGHGGTPPGQSGGAGAPCFLAGTGIRTWESYQVFWDDEKNEPIEPPGLSDIDRFRAHIFGFGVPFLYQRR